MTCKDCIHYEACHDMYYEEHATRHFDPEKHNAEKECGYFKDRSRFIELPCNKINAIVESNIYDEEEIYYDCTVQVLRNSITGETSVGWFRNDEPPVLIGDD